MAVMIPTVLVLMVAHGIEVIVWSFAYAIVSAAADDANLVYFAFVNYTTLGYGRRFTAAALAATRPHNRDERRVAVWMVDRGYLRGASANFGAHSRFPRMIED
jgi:hypothetical protein